ncbi:leishmanolysin [Trypanosoma rangeli SC58]|uniref:Leishmanolysin-like peptidase n=1 Tax=Trypanosoma rangeli SC58 TaxID=429131 RepID=A0A061ITZ4_TRYRA|nr:leishmanolysin [Trypanosoma rangeli SC58]
MCSGHDVLTEANKDIVLKQLIPAAIKLHTERLSVKPVRGPIRIPQYEIGLCSGFTIPSWHHTTGVSGADLILYVNALPTDGTVAWADVCVTLEDGRPYAGALDFVPQYIKATHDVVGTAAHEIGHILGFSPNNVLWLNMLSRIPNVRGKRDVWVVSSPKVKALARQHYNCPTLEGMELEDEGAAGGILNHWKKRSAPDELMAPEFPTIHYSAITLAAFEDLGVYRANYSMADPLRWGKNSGCELLENKCLTNDRTAYPELFCKRNGDKRLLICTYNRLSLGYCGLLTQQQPLPPQYQYFDNPMLGGIFGAMDYCPYVTGRGVSGCINGNTDTFPGSFIGLSSRCVKGEGLHFGRREMGDVCVNTQCSGGRLRVQLLGDDTWYDCNEGETVVLSGRTWRGSITCPKYADVCTVLSGLLAHAIPVVAPPLVEEPNHWDTADTNDESGGTNPDVRCLARNASAAQ